MRLDFELVEALFDPVVVITTALFSREPSSNEASRGIFTFEVYEYSTYTLGI